ncbi:MAG TPA: hypothetical protein VLH77_02430, partial [Gammaproteobacteria bacterium]|nr:hypothetical protein [Gammaproteobacteria bacterium]
MLQNIKAVARWLGGKIAPSFRSLGNKIASGLRSIGIKLGIIAGVAPSAPVSNTVTPVESTPILQQQGVEPTAVVQQPLSLSASSSEQKTHISGETFESKNNLIHMLPFDIEEKIDSYLKRAEAAVVARTSRRSYAFFQSMCSSPAYQLLRHVVRGEQEQAEHMLK